MIVLRSSSELLAGADKQRQRTARRRGPGRPFEKGNAYSWTPGQSGNYQGRPKCITLSESYRKALAEIDERILRNELLQRRLRLDKFESLLALLLKHPLMRHERFVTGRKEGKAGSRVGSER